jgi:hypothetical protein
VVFEFGGAIGAEAFGVGCVVEGYLLLKLAFEGRDWFGGTHPGKISGTI